MQKRIEVEVLDRQLTRNHVLREQVPRIAPPAGPHTRPSATARYCHPHPTQPIRRLLVGPIPQPRRSIASAPPVGSHTRGRRPRRTASADNGRARGANGSKLVRLAR